MKHEELKVWREQTRFHWTFVSGDDRLTIAGLLRFDGDSPNSKPRCELEFFGSCEDEDGELVRRKKRYDIKPEVAKDIVQAMEALSRFEKDRPPEIARERFRETADGFVVSLKQTPDKMFFVLQRPSDGWRFEAEDRDQLFRGFCDAAE